MVSVVGKAKAVVSPSKKKAAAATADTMAAKTDAAVVMMNLAVQDTAPLAPAKYTSAS